MAIYLFYGDNLEAIRNEAKRWQEGFLEKNPDSPNLSIITQPDNPSSIIAEIKSMPFLGDKRLVIIHNFYNTHKGTDQYDDFVKQLKDTPETTIAVFIEETPPAKNAKILKDIKKLGEVKEFKKSKSELAKEFQKIIKKEEKTINPQTLNQLIQNLQEDPYKIKNEAKKLALYTENQEITQKEIDELVRFDTQVSVFNLMDQLTAKQIKNCMETLHQIQESGEDLIKLFFLIARQIRILIQIKSLSQSNLTPGEIAKMTKLPPFVVNKTIKQVKQFEAKKLTNLLQTLLTIDTKIKTGELKYSKSSPEGLLFEIEQFLLKATS